MPPVHAARPEKKAILEVQVEVTEVDHATAKKLGIDWLDQVRFEEARSAGPVSLGALIRPTNLAADLNFLIQEGAAELLANPNLVTDSGTEAAFHAGGEIPYITTGSLGTSHVEFKPYGVALKVRPLLLSDGRIRMKLQASVSAPDQTNGVLLAGVAVPALLERKVSANVTVWPGATTALAGMVQSMKEKTVQGIPLLRRIPLLGRLFQWKKTNSRRTTVVIFVTPQIVE